MTQITRKIYALWYKRGGDLFNHQKSHSQPTACTPLSRPSSAWPRSSSRMTLRDSRPALRPRRPKADRDTLRSNHVSPLTTSPSPAHLLRGLDLPHERRDVTWPTSGGSTWPSSPSRPALRSCGAVVCCGRVMRLCARSCLLLVCRSCLCRCAARVLVPLLRWLAVAVAGRFGGWLLWLQWLAASASVAGCLCARLVLVPCLCCACARAVVCLCHN